jgi:hypothetical protein
MLKILAFKSSLASKIDFILQLGYFKSKHQFFTFTLNDVPEDVSYIINRYFPNKILTKSTLGRAARYLNQKYIVRMKMKRQHQYLLIFLLNWKQIKLKELQLIKSQN